MREASLRQQRLRLGNLLRAHSQRGRVQLISRRARRVRRQDAVPLIRGLQDLVAIVCQLHRLPHPHVVERLMSRVHDDVVVEEGGGGENLRGSPRLDHWDLREGDRRREITRA